jgi:hypothetical protein
MWNKCRVMLDKIRFRLMSRRKKFILIRELIQISKKLDKTGVDAIPLYLRFWKLTTIAVGRCWLVGRANHVCWLRVSHKTADIIHNKLLELEAEEKHIRAVIIRRGKSFPSYNEYNKLALLFLEKERLTTFHQGISDFILSVGRVCPFETAWLDRRHSGI